jgi:hypothetical protein
MPYQKSKVSSAGSGSLDRLPLVGFEYCHQVSSTPGEQISPTELAEGELAMNTGDGVLLYKTPSGEIGKFPSSVGFNSIVVLEEAAYDLIVEKDPNVLYIVTPNPE